MTNTMEIPYKSWNDMGEDELTEESLLRLFKGEIPFIKLSNFAAVNECEQLVTSAIKEGFSSYRGVEPIINRIGNTVFEYNNESKTDYFEKNIELIKVQNRIFERSFNPLERFIKTLRTCTKKKDVKIPINNEGIPYYAGLIRRIENGTLLHVDFAPGEQPDWEVADICEQLAWNLYLRLRYRQRSYSRI